MTKFLKIQIKQGKSAFALKFMLLLGVMFGGTLGAGSVFAQQKNALLEKVSNVYKGYERIQADFSVQFFRNDQDQTGQGESGKLFLSQKDGKYRISTSQQEIISDGTVQWAILKDADEVQITEVGQQEDAITPFNIFSFFNTGFSSKQGADAKVGTTQLGVVELTPTDAKRHYSKVVVRVNKANNHVYDVTVYDKNKSRIRYQIKNLSSNPTFVGNMFVFNKDDYPGMEIVDLR